MESDHYLLKMMLFFDDDLARRFQPSKDVDVVVVNGRSLARLATLSVRADLPQCHNGDGFVVDIHENRETGGDDEPFAILLP